MDLIQNNHGLFGLALNRLLKNTKEIKMVIDELFKLYDEGLIRPEINRVYGLDNITDAHIYQQSGESTGKLILRLND